MLTVRVLQHGGIPVHGTVHGADAVGTFVLMSTIAFSGAFSWASYASDYSRYLPTGTKPLRVALSAGLGLLVTCGVLEVAGAALATVAGTRWGLTDIPTDQFVRPLPEILVIVAPLAICVGAVSANAIGVRRCIGGRADRLTL